jgi:hypothetical protein
LLGRRNAQAFFRANFSLPVSNPLFDGFPEALREKWLVRDIDSGELHMHDTERGKEPGLPIIPLTPEIPGVTPDMMKEIAIGESDLPHPQAFDDPVVRGDLQTAIEKRAVTVVTALVENDLKAFTSGPLGYFKRLGARHFGKDMVVAKANDAIFGDGGAIDSVRNAFFETKF